VPKVKITAAIATSVQVDAAGMRASGPATVNVAFAATKGANAGGTQLSLAIHVTA